jgi:hypothetical protein
VEKWRKKSDEEKKPLAAGQKMSARGCACPMWKRKRAANSGAPLNPISQGWAYRREALSLAAEAAFWVWFAKLDVVAAFGLLAE